MGSTFSMLEQVQQWIDTTKLPLEEVDPVLLDSAQSQVFARVSRVYDSTNWVDQDTIPALVQQAMALLVASWIYDRAYSEDTSEENKYSLKLESMAEALIEGIESGTISLIDANEATMDIPPEQPIFLPNDTTGAAQLYSALGREIGDLGSEDIKFRMGSVF